MNYGSQNILVNQVMQKDVVTLNDEDNVLDASVKMRKHNIGALPIVRNDGKLVGIITDRDIVINCNALGKDPIKTKAIDCMTKNPVRVVPSTSCSHAILLMKECNVRRLPVVEHEKLIGIISIDDIASILEPPKEDCYFKCDFIYLAKELERASHRRS